MAEEKNMTVAKNFLKKNGNAAKAWDSPLDTIRSKICLV